MKKKIEVSLLSKYRTELMGWAILFIMLTHAFAPNWASIRILQVIAGKFDALAHTSGFFILSGLGLYYSFTKNNNLLIYYKKRVLRVWIPFFIVAFPILLFYFFIGVETPISFFGDLTGLSFFWYSSISLWYISVTILLYLLFPCFYKFIFSGKSYIVNTAIVFAAFFSFYFILFFFFNDYYLRTEMRIGQMPAFVAGIYMGYLSYNKKSINNFHFFLLVALTASLLLASKYNPLLSTFYKASIPVWGLFIISLLYQYLERYIWGQKILLFLGLLGKYSFELYVLHMMIKFLLITLYEQYTERAIDIQMMRIVVLIDFVLTFILLVPVHKLIKRIVSYIK